MREKLEDADARVVGVRLPVKYIERWDALAEASFRSRAEVMQLLLNQADLRGAPDIWLNPIPRAPVDRVETETVDVAD